MRNINKRQKTFRIFFCVDAVMLIFLLIITIYQTQVVSNAQAVYDQFTSTPIGEQKCWELCPKAYSWQRQQECCIQSTNDCQVKEQCKQNKSKEMQTDLNQKQKSLYALIGSTAFFFVLLMLLLCLKIVVKKERERQEANIRRATFARLLFYINHLQQFSEEERERRRSLLTESFITEEREEQCAICLNSFQENRVIKLNCNHIFHSECITSWIELKNSCPVCRTPQ